MDLTKTPIQDKISTTKDTLEIAWKEAQKKYTLLDLIEEVREEVKLSELNIVEEVYTNTEKHHEYIALLFECKASQSYYKRFEKVVYKLLYEYYKFESPVALRTKEDYNKYIYSHELWILMQQLIDHYTQVVDYLYYVDKLFSARNYSISTASRFISG